MPADPRRATYRVQLHGGFTFADAAAVVDYLAALGVSHLYLSPVLQAAPGSTHGYDVVDPTRLNQELGGAAGYRHLASALADHGLGQLVDIVPNHMAIAGPENPWWWDVLENGPASVYASYFDVDWEPPEAKLAGTVLLPVLGDHYGRELEAGRLRLGRQGGTFTVAYFDHVVPVGPRSLDALMATAAAEVAGHDQREELESLAMALGRLPPATRTDSASVHERHRDKEILKVRLGALCDAYPEVAKAVDDQVAALNADADALDRLLSAQNYRLAWWRTAGEELDYRRFFDINDLAGLRVEDAEVFADTHRLVLGLVADGGVDGVRVDHVDGLRDPGTYLRRLRDAAPGAWVVVEKILEADEALPSRWPVSGTTGYDWMSTVGGVLVDPSGYEGLLAGYRDFTGQHASYTDMVHQAKREVLDGPLAADLSRLTNRLAGICEHHRRYRDFTRADLRRTLAEVVAAFGVYRTYVSVDGPPADADIAVVGAAVASAGLSVGGGELDAELLAFLADLLLLRVPGADEREFALRVAQLTGAVMAKAVEDTVFYRYLPLVSLNEVGADPSRPTVTVESYHAACARAHAEHPEGLLATSTHDTKRSEDVRARLAVLSEIPEEWTAAARRWADLVRAGGTAMPDRVTEWLSYQTLVGAWPLDAGRLAAYLEKATREAKVHTSWTDPDPVYDEVVRSFAEGIFGDAAFVADVEAFVARVRRPGWANGLTQKLLTLTAPGVGDLYQGSECWDLSLVDPDNRRPVDYDARRRLLARTEEVGPATAWANESGDGLAKLHVVRSALRLRAARPEWFAGGPDGSYQPLGADGEAAAHLVAYQRGPATDAGGAACGAVVIATRLPATLERRGGWGATTISLPSGKWSDHLGGGSWEGTVALAELLAGLPVALLSRKDTR